MCFHVSPLEILLVQRSRRGLCTEHKQGKSLPSFEFAVSLPDDGMSLPEELGAGFGQGELWHERVQGVNRVEKRVPGRIDLLGVLIRERVQIVEYGRCGALVPCFLDNQKQGDPRLIMQNPSADGEAMDDFRYGLWCLMQKQL